MSIAQVQQATENYATFPARRILADNQVKGIFAAGVLLTIPAEWYYLRTISTSLARNQFAFSVLVTLSILVLCIFIARQHSLGGAGKGVDARRRQSWALSLASVWCITTILLLLSTWTCHWCTGARTDWISLGVSEVLPKVCQGVVICGWLFGNGAEITILTLPIYFVYACFGFLLVSLSRNLIKAPSGNTPGGAIDPSGVYLAVYIALLMLLFHWPTQYVLKPV